MKSISPHRFFLIFAVFFGLIFSIITPPFQVPDEINHFYRAYQISEGNFTALKIDNRVGGYIPESLDLFSFQYKKMSLNKYSKVNFKEIKKTSEISLNAFDKVFTDFPNTALYTPVSYIPQSIAIFILRLLNCKPLYMLYLVRIITLLFWITLVYFAIKIIPFQKWLFVILALLPMSLSVNSSISADIITNALSFLFIAYVIRCAFNNKKFSKKDLIIISLIIISLGLAKVIYVLLLFIFLIIPKRNFLSLKHYIFSFIIILVLGFGFAFGGKKTIDKLYTPYNEYNIEYRENTILNSKANMDEQISFIISNKKQTVKIFATSFFSEFKPMIKSYIGRLGWGDTQLPNFIVLLSYIIIFLIAISSNNKEITFKYRQRLIFFSTSIILLLFIMLSQYLTWVPVGSNRVYPLQGRYFIPVLPLIFVLFFNNKTKINNAYRKYIILLFTLFIGFYSIVYLYNRFYYNYILIKQFEINCNAELLSEDKKFLLTDNDTVKFDNPNIQTDKESRSGDYSIKLSPDNQFGFSYKFNNVKKGDKFVVTVWRTGKEGKIIIQEDAENGLYLKSSKIISKDDNNRYQLESVFFAPKDFTDTGLKIYIWYNAEDSAYFDDYKITFLKKQAM